MLDFFCNFHGPTLDSSGCQVVNGLMSRPFPKSLGNSWQPSGVNRVSSQTRFEQLKPLNLYLQRLRDIMPSPQRLL